MGKKAFYLLYYVLYVSHKPVSKYINDRFRNSEIVLQRQFIFTAKDMPFL